MSVLQRKDSVVCFQLLDSVGATLPDDNDDSVELFRDCANAGLVRDERAKLI